MEPRNSGDTISLFEVSAVSFGTRGHIHGLPARSDSHGRARREPRIIDGPLSRRPLCPSPLLGQSSSGMKWLIRDPCLPCWG